MISSTIRCCCHIKYRNGLLAISNNSFGQISSVISHQKRHYAKNQDNKIAKCAKEISQTKGKKVEPWPKPDPPPPAWRCECPQEPQPPNYDPYRIKVPDVVVPPLPPSNAKWTGVVLIDPESNRPGFRQGYQQGGYPQQQYDEQGNPVPAEEEEKDESLLGILKGFFRGKKDKPSGDAQIIGRSNLQCNEIPNEDGRGMFGNSGFSHDRTGRIQDLFLNSPIVHPDYWKEKPEQKKLPNVVAVVLPRLSYHGKTKYKFAFHEPWKPLDRMALLAKAEEEEENQSEEIAAAEESEKRAS